jgi:hypothetical protein
MWRLGGGGGRVVGVSVKIYPLLQERYTIVYVVRKRESFLMVGTIGKKYNWTAYLAKGNILK